MRWPTPLGGANPLERWLNTLLAAAKASMPLSSADVKPQRTPDGSALKVSFPAMPHPKSFHPFQIYHAQHPTDHSQNWRCFKLRGGWTSYRPTWSPIQGDNSFDDVFDGTTEGVRYLGFAGADGTTFGYPADFLTSRTIPDPSVTTETISIGNSGDFGVSNIDHAALWVLNSASDAQSGPAASWWIEITEPNTGDISRIEIKARMWTGDSPSANSRTKTQFPLSTVSKRIIPIGWVLPREGYGTTSPVRPQDLVPQQILYGNADLRYPVTPINPNTLGATQGPAVFRGTWNGGDTESLTNQVFYDGDEVSVPVVRGGVNYVQLWGHVGVSAESVAPSAGSSWILKAGPV